MLQFFISLKNLLKASSVVIDNSVFQLHYRVTCVILLAFSLMVTGAQYFGDPIECLSDSSIPSKTLDIYCWIHTTFSVESAWAKEVGVEVPYPGVAKYTPGESRVYHAYYQWVSFVLFVQAILFYVPRYLWKAIEGGKMKMLVLGLNFPIGNEETISTNRALLVQYLYLNLNNHNTMFIMYMMTEGLNLVNVILQMVLIDKFLGGEFTTYGWDVIQFSEWDSAVRYDPMIRVFPRMTKCTFFRYGNSGDVEKLDALCLLPLNIVNEKIYIFLWFWFYFLAIITLVALVYRAATIFDPRVRVLVTHSHSSILAKGTLESVLNRCQIGDWFLLNLLSKNLDSINFKDVVIDLHKKLEGKEASCLLKSDNK